MNLHEYQSKQLFRDYGLRVAEGRAVTSVEDSIAAAQALGGKAWVVKAQVHAGGRGKAGGVKLAKSIDEVRQITGKLLGTRLVTHQTTAAGQPINTVYIESAATIAKEYYLAMVIDRTLKCIVFMASTEGGMDIEKVATETPEKIVRMAIDPALDAQPWQGRQLAFQLGISQTKEFVELFLGLDRLFRALDCSLLEINPLVVTEQDTLCCLDAKINIDDNALFRQPQLELMRDLSQENDQERQAEEFGLNYVALDGSIGCMVNGAGLAMATMDLVKLEGGDPANFLDVGGGATQEAVAEAFKIVLSDNRVKAVLINIFGGIVSCVTIAEGIVAAVQEAGVKLPVVVRFEGNNAEAGRDYLQKQSGGVNLIAAEGLLDAAQQVVAAARAQT